MGISAGGGSGNVKSDINVTPLVDVVLVLLIIFLVTMPVVMRTVTLEVPRSMTDVEQTTTSKSIIITYRPDGNVVLSEGPGTEDKRFGALELPAKIRPLLEQKSGEKVVFVDFCNGTPWQDVVSTMDRVRSLATDTNHNDIKVALKKREKKSDIDPTRIDPCS